MNHRSLPLLPIGVLALLVILTFWLSRFVQPVAVRPDAKLRHDPDLIVEHFAARKLSSTGAVEFKVRAERMTHYADDDSSKVVNVLFTAVQPGKPLLTAQSPAGRMYHGSDVIVMEDGVVIVSEATERYPQSVMHTPNLTFESENNLVKTDAGVVINSGNSRMEATSLRLDTDTRHMTLHPMSMTLERRK